MPRSTHEVGLACGSKQPSSTCGRSCFGPIYPRSHRGGPPSPNSPSLSSGPPTRAETTWIKAQTFVQLLEPSRRILSHLMEPSKQILTYLQGSKQQIISKLPEPSWNIASLKIYLCRYKSINWFLENRETVKSKNPALQSI